MKLDWPEVDEKRELESLKQGMGCFIRKEGRLLSSVESDWKQMITDLSTLGGETQDLGRTQLDKLINNSFVDTYYAKTEK